MRDCFQKGLLTAGTKIINKRQVTYKLLADLKGVIINSILLLSLKIVTRSHNMSMYYYNPFFEKMPPTRLHYPPRVLAVLAR